MYSPSCTSQSTRSEYRAPRTRRIGEGLEVAHELREIGRRWKALA